MNCGKTVSPEELGDEPAAVIQDILRSKQYGFACIEMFKPDRRTIKWNQDDAFASFPAWKNSLAIPVDTDLPSEVWATSIAVIIRSVTNKDSFEIQTSLNLLNHYGVNSAIVEIPLDKDCPNYFIENIVNSFAGYPEDIKTSMNIYLAVRKNKHWVPFEFMPWKSSNFQLAVVLNDEDGQGDEEYIKHCFVVGVGMAIISAPVSGLNRKFLEILIARGLPILLTGPQTDELYAWLQSVRYSIPAPEPMQAILDSYNNVLQTPLQPLRDNLSSATYDVFEQDPVKYDKYQEAMELALKDLSVKGTALKIGILGAGRGPLVDRLLLALESLSLVPERIFVVDKSPNACMTLIRRNDLEWSVLYDAKYAGKIEVMCKDIRRMDGPMKLDLIVSELLGSFGDNELAPECLYEAEKLLAKDGVMIPKSYTSWVEPVYCPQLYRKVIKLCKDSNDYSHINRPYTCRIADACYPGEPEAVFEFKHPSSNRKLVGENGEMVARFSFYLSPGYVPYDGFVGYFSAVLYGPVTISTVRGEETPGMFSWFPFYLPFQTDPNDEDGNTRSAYLTIERKWTDRRVWYEWNEYNRKGKYWSMLK